MSSLPELEACLSILPSALPAPASTITSTAILVAPLVLAVVAGIVHYVSPPRLTRVLVVDIANVEKIYLEALETGLLSTSDINTAEMLSLLQLKVSQIREASLRNSLSHSGTLREFFGGCTFTLLRCIREVRVLETHIENLSGAMTAYIPSRTVCGEFVFAAAAIPTDPMLNNYQTWDDGVFASVVRVPLATTSVPIKLSLCLAVETFTEDTTAVGGTSLCWQIDKSCGEGDSDQLNKLLRRLSGVERRRHLLASGASGSRGAREFSESIRALVLAKKSRSIWAGYTSLCLNDPRHLYSSVPHLVTVQKRTMKAQQDGAALIDAASSPSAPPISSDR
ncbi:hypothetical protein B0H13DRAFT_2524510 [Mycena leptocephala]|nr:hypothetical protein B0H13DRAFT_2524510 [Mycena leptocephala]